MRPLLSLVIVAGVVATVFLAAPSSGEPLRRGGTLRVDLTSDFDFIDPSLAYFSHSWQLGFMTEAKLLNFPDREASQGGLRVIPEVARTLPAISRDGKTYTFNLRNTYRFHTGARITAANFVAAFNRNAQRRMNSPGFPFMEDVVGAKAVHAGRARTVSGVRAVGPYKLRIRLERPAGDFMSRMTMPFFSAVPRNMPVNPQGVGAPAGFGGPYYVQSWDKGRTAVLVRNRFYRGPRPSNPDRIVYNIGIALDAQRLRCERGESDVCSAPPSQVVELRDKYGLNRGRFFVKGQAVFWYLNFNHDQPLFRNHDRLKQAVNIGIDRTQVAQTFGPLGAEPTDQMLPIDFPGFRNWNIYSLRADPSRARQLASGNPRGNRVRFYTFNQGFGPSLTQVVQFNLRQIGLEPEVRRFPTFSQMIDAAHQPGAQWDLMPNFWSADFGGPDPYGFINTLLRDNPNRFHFNIGRFDEPTWNARLDRMSTLRGTARLNAYGTLERDLLTGPAPVVPLVNTNARVFVSQRVQNYIFHKIYGTDFGALNVTD